MFNLKTAPRNTEYWEKLRLLTQEVYNTAYGAGINPTPDEFIYLEKDGEVMASFGLSYRKEKPLFSENYLDTTLDELNRSLKTSASSEVGSFISMKKGFGYKLYRVLPHILKEKEVEFSLVTLTRKVKVIFDRLNYHTLYLTDALEERVNELGKWGNFYDSKPKTYIFDIGKSLRNILFSERAKINHLFVCDLGRVLNKGKYRPISSEINIGNGEQTLEYHQNQNRY